MKWISVKDRLPKLEPLPESGTEVSESVLLWVYDPLEEASFPIVGNYSTHHKGWLADQEGALHTWGLEVTYWAEIEPPAA